MRSIAAAPRFLWLLASLYLFYAYDPVKGGFQFVQRIWNGRDESAFSLHLGVDGESGRLSCSRPSLLLFAGILVHSAHQGPYPEESFAFWLLILAAATIGVFMSLDLFFLYFLLRDVRQSRDVFIVGDVGSPHQASIWR